MILKKIRLKNVYLCILNSEQNDECIDFTMMYILYCVCILYRYIREYTHDKL